MIEIKVKVELGVSGELRGLVRELILGEESGETAQPEPQPEPEAMPEPEVLPEPEEKPEIKPEAAPSVQAAPAGGTPAEVTPPTNEEMKTMMDIAISRFAGNGWQETKDPKVIRIQKECTKAFKQIARLLGAEKPTALQGEKRTAFLAELDNLYLNGETVEWKAF